MNRPPAGVDDVLACVLLLLSDSPEPMQTDWSASRRALLGLLARCLGSGVILGPKMDVGAEIHIKSSL